MVYSVFLFHFISKIYVHFSALEKRATEPTLLVQSAEWSNSLCGLLLLRQSDLTVLYWGFKVIKNFSQWQTTRYSSKLFIALSLQGHDAMMSQLIRLQFCWCWRVVILWNGNPHIHNADRISYHITINSRI